MATDRNGNTIAVGDPVNIPGVIKSIQEGIETHVQVEVVPKPMSTDPPTYVAVDPRQIVKS